MLMKSVCFGVKTKSLDMVTSVPSPLPQCLFAPILGWLMKQYSVTYGKRSMRQKHLVYRQVVQVLCLMMIVLTKIKPMDLLHVIFGVNYKNLQLEQFAQGLQHAHMKTTLHPTMMSYANFGMKMFGSRMKLMVLDQMQRLPLYTQLDLVEVRVAKL